MLSETSQTYITWQMPHDSTYVRDLKGSSSWKQKVRWVLPGDVGTRNRKLLESTEFQYGKIQSSDGGGHVETTLMYSVLKYTSKMVKVINSHASLFLGTCLLWYGACIFFFNLSFCY